ncbi:hypothetical protein [Pseudomonas typographi]|uniref:hypothetical protein n=1 Tax=Pseudomonas typographi TaxID=2715964 RepID=UPI001683AF08|nr:hypothetical protein [Pseudomonas typographi]MBD1553859.1 hypothetical protein [Pseudomonas typographi]
MSVYQRYFRITEGPVVDEIDRLFDLRIAAGKLYQDLATKYGAAEAQVYERSGSFAGFTFATPPDQIVYRRDKRTRLWLPRKNVPGGKAIWEEIDSLPTTSPIAHALRLVDLEPGLPMLTSGGRWYAPCLWGFGAPHNIWFVSVPWKDVDPEKLAAYRAEKAEGKCFDRGLDALIWEPPADWAEVKSWQIEKEAEEIRAQLA